MNKTPAKMGRPAGEIAYEFVEYNSCEYVVGTIQHNKHDVKFVFDREDYEKVAERSWHVSSHSYVSSAFIADDKKRKELYLHNLVMNRLEFNGKGQSITVDHINRIGFDNRKINLRLSSQTDQNINQKTKARNITLPEGCEIIPEDIPRHIWYIKANGGHGDRFAIEFKSENVCWKTTSSVKVSLKDKLTQATAKLQEYYAIYPHLNPLNPEKINEENTLKKSFDDIINLTNQIPLGISRTNT